MVKDSLFETSRPLERFCGRTVHFLALFFGFLVGWHQALADEKAGSLHELQTEWRDQDNRPFKMSDLKGSKVIMGMIYSSCPHACPMTIKKIKDIEAQIKKGVRYRIVLASFDFKVDKPEKLKREMEKHKLDPRIWTLLSPDSDEKSRELALILGISYKPIDNGDFSHSNSMSLLSPSGEIVSRLEGLNSDPMAFLKALNGP